SKARGLAIAATVVAAVHLVLGFVVANNTKAGRFVMPAIPLFGMLNRMEQVNKLFEKMQKETDPKRQQELQKELRDLTGGGDADGPFGGQSRRSGDEMRWQDLTTLNPFADQFIGRLCYDSKDFSNYLLPLLGGLVEVARLVLVVLLLGAVGRAARDYDVADRAKTAALFAGGATVAAMFVMLLVFVILDNATSKTPAGPSSGKGPLHWLALGELIVYGLHTAALFLPATLALRAKDACD
ncbi:MAG: hypothetical protein K2V38_11570, partial [Gemmataceae bacterium]|nr:hypothetical protein [Gemmataceae bacterium]